MSGWGKRRANVKAACAGSRSTTMSANNSRLFELLESRTLFAVGDLELAFTQDFVHRNDFALALAVQSDDKIVLAGWISTGTSAGNDFALARFNADGTLDG